MQHLGEFRPTNPFNFQINFQMHCISLLHKISSSFSRFDLQLFLWIESSTCKPQFAFSKFYL